ncbi:sensor histidine kinase [Acrocarpospora sp. B8E8]|uniref:sensor histidine kinase n=1 Tax=Acrocarpospora sp. B8E8 TaxID=3153572 RepID=UPI00325EBA37
MTTTNLTDTPYDPLRSGDDGDDELCASWNSKITHRPEIAISAATAEEARHAVALAAPRRLLARVQETGHGAIEAADGGLLIVTSAMSDVTVDPGSGTALVQVGLVGVIAGVYVLATAVSSFFLAGVDQLFGLAAALVAGAFFQPTRRALQRLADHVLYGTRGDPIALADGLKARLQQTDPVHGLLAALETLKDGLAVTGAAAEVDGATTIAGKLSTIAHTVPLVWHGQPVGTLLIGPTGRRRFPAAHDERVIAALTPYVADAAHAMRLTTALQRSRERILTAREEERRRLRRDLHDGLGQTLTMMAMTLNMARVSLTRSPDVADILLKELRSGMDAVSGDIRELVYGLRPPALDDLGLAGAVRQLAVDGPIVEIAGDLDGLPAAVEVAAYRIVQEGLTNIRKHANATSAEVALRREDALIVEISDDGVGLPETLKPGVGLRSMRERAAELGGTCTIASDRSGTTVTARLPL